MSHPLGLLEDVADMFATLGCPVCHILARCREIVVSAVKCIFGIASRALASTLDPRPWWYNGSMMTFHKLHDFIIFMGRLAAAQVMEPVTLGAPPLHGFPKSEASRPEETSIDSANPKCTQPLLHEMPCGPDEVHHLVNEPIKEGAISRDRIVKDGREFQTVQSKTDYGGDEDVVSLPKVEENTERERQEYDAILLKPSVATDQSRAPKKMVSINDKVEIYPSKNKKKKRQRLSMEDKLPSMEGEVEGPKPLKSILKVSSKGNGNEKSGNS